MKRKGVSPIIATVLLIGMVIALALIIFIWMRSFTRETITKFEDENIELACDKVEFQASMIGSEVSILNLGNVPIYDLKLKIIGAGGYTSESIRDSSNWPKYGLNPGSTFVGTITGLSTAEEVVLIPVLLGNSEKGKRTFICERNEYEL